MPNPDQTTTLPGALASEIRRVTDLRAEYREAQAMTAIGNMAPAIFMMSRSLDAAVAAAGSPDIVGQVRALSDLRGYES
jgi:hypothetical protein